MAKKSKEMVSTKSNNLVDAGFFKRLNSMEMRLVNLAISKLNPTRSIAQNRRFEFTVKEFLDCNSGVANYADIYDNVRSAVLNLGKVWVEVEPMDGYDKTEVSLLTRRSYAKGQGSFMIEFHEDVMPYLAEIKHNYTSILLETFGSLKSEYSLRLYEFLSRWAYRGRVKISVNEMKDLLGVSDNYSSFFDFKRYALAVGVKEINAKTNLSVDFKTFRTGRFITDLEFTIWDKSKAIKAESKKSRPKFPHKNKYGKFVRLDKQNPKMSSNDYDLYARDCLKILEEYYSELDEVTNDDLRNYWVFLSVNASNKSKFGSKSIFIDELKKRGYKLVECELVKLEK